MAERLGVQTKVPEVDDGEVSGGDELRQVAIGHDPDVLDDLLRRRAEETQDMEGVGRFGWVTDPEGNRLELWQPA